LIERSKGLKGKNRGTSWVRGKFSESISALISAPGNGKPETDYHIAGTK